jgi:hypothetical protein
MTFRKDASRGNRLRRRSLPDFPPKYLGFIFCEIFSNLVATGCRRGRTPERPLRQPPKVWLMKPGLSHACADRPVPLVCMSKSESADPVFKDRAPKGHKLVSQGVAF